MAAFFAATKSDRINFRSGQRRFSVGRIRIAICDSDCNLHYPKARTSFCRSGPHNNFYEFERSALPELSKRIELSNEPNMLPGFQYAGRKFCFLNSGFDVEIGGVTYHLSSEFSDKGEMGTVIEIIELERNQRNSA